MGKIRRASVLVCVTGQRDCDRLIVAGRRIADEKGGSLQVLCVQPTSSGYDVRSDEIEYLRVTSVKANAEMTVFFHDDPALIAAGFVRQIGAKHIVTGMPDNRADGFVEIIHSLVPSVPISMVSPEGTIYNLYPSYQNVKPVKISAQG